MSDFVTSIVKLKRSNEKLLKFLVILKLISFELINGYFFIIDDEEFTHFSESFLKQAINHFPELKYFFVNIEYENTVRSAYYFSLKETQFSSSVITQKEQCLYWYPSHITYCEPNSTESINIYTYYINASFGETCSGSECTFDSFLQFETSLKLETNITTFLHNNNHLNDIVKEFNLYVSYSVKFNYAYVEKKLRDKVPFTEAELETISLHLRQNDFRDVSTRIKQNKKKNLINKYGELELCIKASKIYNENRWDSNMYIDVTKLDKKIDEKW